MGTKSHHSKRVSGTINRVLAKKIRIEKAICSISSLFTVNYDLENSINQALEILGELVSADRVYIYRLHRKSNIFRVSHEWIRPDSGSRSITSPSLPAKDIGWLTEQLQSKKMIYIPDTGTLPEQALNGNQLFAIHTVRSFAAYPITIREKTEGFLGINFITGKNQNDYEELEVLKVISDIIGFSIERKQIDNMLRKTEEMYQRIYENTGAATVTLRTDTTILMSNHEFERLIGIPKHEVEGKKRLLDFIDKKDQSALKRYHYLLLSNHEATPHHHEFSYINIEGESRYAFVTGATLLDPKTIILSFIDITDFKHTEKQLRISKEKAEESDRLKSAFLANVSHEIRTPLNAITGFSALLANPHLSIDKKEKYIKQILTGSNELVNLIENVLDISRIESKTLKAKISEVLLNNKLHEIKEFYDDLKTHHGKENLELRIKIPPDNESLKIKTDPLLLQQILGNLIDNAIKFTSSGFVELGYSILPSHIQELKKGSILFFVKDSGIGIAKKDKDRIFERFVKVIDKKGCLYRGAGLGLTLARDLVHLLNGEIWVESAFGKGSTFYFTIPYTEPKIKDKKGKRTDVKEKINYADKTILIAEDTESNYLYLKEILNSTGVHLLRARNGQEAIEIFRKNKDTIDLIFMDILMPECDGFESSHRIRDIRDDIIIIAQTAFTFEGEIEDGLYAGCFTDYILKPFNVKAIHRLLEKYLVRK